MMPPQESADHRRSLPVIVRPLGRLGTSPVARPVMWSPWARRGVRLVRLLVLIAAVMLLRISGGNEARETPPIILPEAQRLFPKGVALTLPEADLPGDIIPARGALLVRDGSGAILGQVLRTAPETNDIIGYSGPTDLLLGLDPQGKFLRAAIAASGDTPAHVEKVRRDREWWTNLAGWVHKSPGERGTPAPVSGATLTSFAIAESVARRLSGEAIASLKFPDPITIEEVAAIFPAAQTLEDMPGRRGWLVVRDGQGRTIGHVLRSGDDANAEVRGYAGPTDVLIAVDPTATFVTAVRVRKSFETKDYADRVRRNIGYLDSLTGKSVEETAARKVTASGFEGVSGATQTSYAVAESLTRRLARDVPPPAQSQTMRWSMTERDVWCMVILTFGTVVTFLPYRAWMRHALQSLIVILAGMWLGQLLSLSLLTGWGRHGVPWAGGWPLVALAVVGLFTPWATKRQIYCHSLCPHGAVQEWLGRDRRRHIRLPIWLSRGLAYVPATLLIAAFLGSLLVPSLDLARWEPFDAWSLGTAAIASFVILVGSLITAIFVPQGYCRFGCPTGALLKYLRSHGTTDRWGLRDTTAIIVLGLGTLAVLPRTLVARPGTPSLPVARPAAADELPTLKGEIFGTTWSLRSHRPFRDAASLERAIREELTRIERTLSHWSTDSETSQFNAAETTFPMEVSDELLRLVERAVELSRATDGAFDITLAPVIDAWGYGPSGPKETPPTDAELETLRSRVGWQKLILDRENHTLAKQNPSLQIDLGSLLQGYAVDRAIEIVRQQGETDALMEIGGELRALGEWKVALEDPVLGHAPSWSLTLTNNAISTSGTYHARPLNAGISQPGNHDSPNEQPSRHIISSKTFKPVEGPWILCAVNAATCLDSDAWDTALFVAPNGLEIADHHGLAALFNTANGTPRLTKAGEGVFHEEQ